jgi:hypothetical protein
MEMATKIIKGVAGFAQITYSSVSHNLFLDSYISFSEISYISVV